MGIASQKTAIQGYMAGIWGMFENWVIVAIEQICYIDFMIRAWCEVGTSAL